MTINHRGFKYLVFAKKEDMSKIIDLTGQTYGRLTAISFHSIKNRRHFWNCVCDCGKHHLSSAENLRFGYVKSCGCSKAQGNNRSHGESKARTTKEYRTWAQMRGRCYNKKHDSFNNYGGRGITVCERWKKYQNFLADMGRAPSTEHSIDRKNNNGNYEPGNCRWATKKEQSNNTRKNRFLEYKGQFKTISQWSDLLNRKHQIVRNRLHIGWSIERALETPT